MFNDTITRWQYFTRSIAIMILSYVLMTVLFEYYNFFSSMRISQNVLDYEYIEYVMEYTLDYYQHRLQPFLGLDAYISLVFGQDFIVNSMYFFVVGLIFHCVMTILAIVIVQIYWIVCSVKRLRDIGRDPWLSLIILVPIIKYMLFLYLSLRAGKKVLTHTP